jgi:tankyrase
MKDILNLRDLRESETIRKVECRDDAILLLKSCGISLDKHQFFKALLNGDKELMDLFMRANFNIHIEDDQGTPPILIAMKKGYTVIAHILLNAGADINACDRMGITPLMLTCGKSTQGYKELAEWQIQKGAILNVQDKLGYTPLLLSLSGGDAVIAELLIEKGADLLAQTRNGETALSFAEKAGNTRIIELLRNKLG